MSPLRTSPTPIAPPARTACARNQPNAGERPRQTLRFLARLFVEMGHRGWVILFDELELIRLQGPVGGGGVRSEVDAKELTHLSLPDIGEAFGGRDHTTVLHACRKIAALKTTSHEITRDFDSLLKVLRG